MEVEGWQDALFGTRAAYEKELEESGFVPWEGERWRGMIRIPIAGGGEADEPHLLHLPNDFPFSCPRVVLAQPPLELTWHIDGEGGLCLYRRDERGDRPWQTVDGLLERVREWHANALAGWPDDPAEVDLGDYFAPSVSETLLTYDALNELIGRTVTAERRATDWYHLEPGASINRKYRRRGGTWAFALDLGCLERPVANWQSLIDRASDQDRNELQRLAGTRRPGFLVVRYERVGNEGVREAAVALRASPRDDGGCDLVAIDTANDSPMARTFRAGPDADLLSHNAIAIVGCGAVGSFLAEQLARAGVGRLSLIDPDRLHPGNCVRHLADVHFVPQPKVDAVRSILAQRRLIDAHLINTTRSYLTPELAFDLATSHAVVVDAAADAGATGLLCHMSEVTRALVVKVGIHRDGAVVRVDRFGPYTADRDHRPAPIADLPSRDVPYREAGCGDPVSPTPPHAVLQAAALACRMAIDSVRPLRRRLLPDSIVDVLVPQPDEPYRIVGTST